MQSTFDKFLEVLPSHLTDDEKIVFIQRAYKYVVKKIRLDLSNHPIRFQKHTVLGDLESPSLIVSSNSEIAVKTIKNITGCYFAGSMPEDLEEVSAPSFGNLYDTDYGYTDFDLVNDKHNSIPTVFVSNRNIHSTDVDDCMLIVQTYDYPHLLTTASGIYTDKTVYDIQTMYDTYGPENLYVSDALGTLTLLATKMLMAEDELNATVDSFTRKFLLIIINFHNRNTRTMGITAFTQIGLIDGSESLNADS